MFWEFYPLQRSFTHSPSSGTILSCVIFPYVRVNIRVVQIPTRHMLTDQASMDAEVITTVEQLRGEVAEIRKLGRRWGFEDGEINECLSEALDAVNKSSPKSKKPVGQLGKLGKCLRYGCFTLIAFLLAIFVFFAVISMMDEKSTAFLTKYLVSLSYPLLRYSRLMFLPVHGMFNVTGW